MQTLYTLLLVMNEANTVIDAVDIEAPDISLLVEAIDDADLSIGGFHLAISKQGDLWWSSAHRLGRIYIYATPFATSNDGIDVTVPLGAGDYHRFIVPMTIDPDGDMENDVKTYFEAMRSVWPELMEMIGAT